MDSIYSHHTCGTHFTHPFKCINNWHWFINNYSYRKIYYNTSEIQIRALDILFCLHRFLFIFFLLLSWGSLQRILCTSFLPVGRITPILKWNSCLVLIRILKRMQNFPLDFNNVRRRSFVVPKNVRKAFGKGDHSIVRGSEVSNHGDCDGSAIYFNY